MKALRIMTGAALVVLVVGSSAWSQSGAQVPVTDQRIAEAIAKGCDRLKELQRDDGSWAMYPDFTGATTSLAVQALLLAGEPPDSPCIQKAAVALSRMKVERTYAVACRAMAYALLTKHYPKLKSKLAGDAHWLSRNQLPSGMWGYKSRRESNRGDNSNTQFAVIGLRDASLAGVEVGRRTWGRLRQHYTETQLPDGGWSYRPPEEGDEEKTLSSVTVTAPSLASLMIANDELQKAVGCPCASGRSKGGRFEEEHVEKGIQWLIKFFDGDTDANLGAARKWATYFYYGLQRAGQASGLKTFGRHDWYKKGSSSMYGRSRAKCLRPFNPALDSPDSRLNEGKDDFDPPQIITKKVGDREKKYVVTPESIVDVSLAIIFLAKGNAPVYMNKLKYDGQWNRHKRDLPLVTQEVARRLERPFRWQVVDVRSDLEDWMDSPLLYLSGEDELELSDEQKQKLKRFCMQGGTLLIESNCGNRQFTADARSLVKELWPQWPLKELPQGHPVYNCQLQIDAEGLLEGVDDGIRTFCLFTDSDFSCAWQMRDAIKDKPKFDMAVNLYAYATDKAPPPSRLVETQARLQAQRKAKEEWEKAQQAEAEKAREEGRQVRRIPKPEFGSDAELEVEMRDIEAGAKNLISVNMLKHGGNHERGLHYGIMAHLISEFQQKLGVTLAMGEALEASRIVPGLPELLVVRGDEAMGLDDQQKQYLADYITGGGFVVAEAVMGRKAFDKNFREFIDGAEGLELVPVEEGDPLLTGEFSDSVQGIAITKSFFSRTVREENPGITKPRVLAIKAGDRIAGYYSPFDVTYSSTGAVAYGIRGYDKNSALAILINMFLRPTMV